MSDILSAASLLLIIVTVLYALWYPELIIAINIEIPKHSEDRPAPLADVNKILFSRAIPLFLSSLIVSMVFVPDAINIIYEVINRKTEVAYKYSSVKTAICVVVFFSVGLTIHSGNMLRKIVKIE